MHWCVTSLPDPQALPWAAHPFQAPRSLAPHALRLPSLLHDPPHRTPFPSCFALQTICSGALRHWAALRRRDAQTPRDTAYHTRCVRRAADTCRACGGGGMRLADGQRPPIPVALGPRTYRLPYIRLANSCSSRSCRCPSRVVSAFSNWVTMYWNSPTLMPGQRVCPWPSCPPSAPGGSVPQGLGVPLSSARPPALVDVIRGAGVRQPQHWALGSR